MNQPKQIRLTPQQALEQIKFLKARPQQAKAILQAEKRSRTNPTDFVVDAELAQPQAAEREPSPRQPETL